MSNLLATLSAAGSVKLAATLDKSAFFNARDEITTDLPILNVAFSGDINGGFTPGLTILAGASKSFKTMLSFYCMKAYLNKYPDAVVLFYDSEFGSNPEHMARFGIDTSRVIHIPIEHVEQLKFDIVKRLEQVKNGDKVFILVDSLGNLASKKEVEDAENEKSVADMSRAKAIRSMLRIITPHLTMKDLPCFIINHVYETMEMYSKVVIPGGTAVTYAANQIFVITKAQEKDTKTNQITGWHFTINIEKSRRVKERSKLAFTVNYEKGIRRDSGMLDLAIEAGLVIQSGAWYTLVDPETGELAEKKVRSSEIVGSTLGKLVRSEKFSEYVRKKFELTGDLIQNDEGESIDDLVEEDI